MIKEQVQTFPSQKKPYRSKTDHWRKSHFKWLDKFLDVGSPIRASLYEKDRAFRSFVGKLRKEDYISIFNPSNIKGQHNDVSDSIQHLPIAVPYLNVLIGEEFDRRFEWRAVVTNPDTISKIEQDKTNLLRNEIARIVQDTSINEEEAVKQLEKFQKYLVYNYRDLREVRCNQLLKHYIKELDLKLKFNGGFKNVMITSEEAYVGDIVNGNPYIELIDPKKIFVLRSGSSNKFEDADVIIMYDYWSPGQILDRYYRHLSEDDVRKLDKDYNETLGTHNGSDQERSEFNINLGRKMLEDTLNISEFGGEKFNAHIQNENYIDEYGNIRVIRLFWKSKKMIKRVKSYSNGIVKYDYYSEDYIPNKALGEEVEKYWVSHWWEGVKVADDIYPFIRPRELQFNKLSDPGYNHPGIVGHVYNVNGMQATSLLNRAMPYQLLYDATHHRMIDAMSKFFGSMPVVDLAEIPEGWDLKKWLFFAKKAGIMVKDSFKEAKKGRATGMIAGGLSGSQNVMNQSGLGDYIQQQLNILNFLETQMGRIMGVSPQRLGDVANRETVGGVERAVTQSSFITNEYYKIHDNVKKRVLVMLLELCKVAYKDNPTKFQNISDTFVNEIFSVDDSFIEEDYGIIVDNDVDISKLEQKLEMLIQAGLQNQMLKFSDVMKLYTSSSLADIQRQIEASEDNQEKRLQEQEQAAQQAQQAQDEMYKQIEEQKLLAEEKAQIVADKQHQDKLALDRYKVDEQESTKRMDLNIKTVSLMETGDSNRASLEAEYDRIEQEMLHKMKDLDEKIRSNKAKEIIALKAASQKIASSNKTNSK